MLPTQKVRWHNDSFSSRVADTKVLDQRRTFLNEILYFIEMTQVEQHIRLSLRLPTVAEYWHYRLGTSAARVASALID